MLWVYGSRPLWTFYSFRIDFRRQNMTSIAGVYRRFLMSIYVIFTSRRHILTFKNGPLAERANHYYHDMWIFLLHERYMNVIWTLNERYMNVIWTLYERVADGCSCRVNIPLEFPYGINDVSCHSAWVGQTGLPAKVTVEAGGPGPVSPFSGVFQGFNPDQNNGGHISTYTLDGAFAGGWVYELTFAAWFKLDPSYG